MAENDATNRVSAGVFVYIKKTTEMWENLNTDGEEQPSKKTKRLPSDDKADPFVSSSYEEETEVEKNDNDEKEETLEPPDGLQDDEGGDNDKKTINQKKKKKIL